VKLRDDATEEQIETVVDRADQYFADHDSRWVDWTVISVSIGLFSMNIDKTKNADDDLRDLLRDVRADTRYVGAEVGSMRCDFALAGQPSAEALVAGLDESAELLASHRAAGGDVAISIAAELDGFPEYQLTQREYAGRPDAAIAALEVLWATTMPGTARVDNETFSVTLAGDAAVPAALALVTEMLAGSAVIEITVEGP